MARRDVNSVGKTGRDVRKFCREVGVKPTAANVEKMGRELRRTEAENENVGRIAKESGRGGTYDEKGKVTRERIKRNIQKRSR